MRGVIVILSIIVLAVAVGAAVVVGGPYVDAFLPRAEIGHPVTRTVPATPVAETVEGEVAAVSETTTVTHVPIILYPNGDAGVSQYTLDFDVPIERRMIEMSDEGIALVPTDQKADYQGPAARYRVVLTRKLARKNQIVLLANLPNPAMADKITIAPDSGLLGMLVVDFGVSPAQLDMAVTGARVAVPAFVALLLLWVITALARLGGQPTLTAADRVPSAARRGPLGDPKAEAKAKEYKAERDFWRDAVRQFLTDRRVDEPEADRMLDGIEAALKSAKSDQTSAPKRPLVAKRVD